MRRRVPVSLAFAVTLALATGAAVSSADETEGFSVGETESRIETADSAELASIASELKSLPAAVIAPSLRIGFLTMIGDRYAALSRSGLAADFYQQALAVLHSGEREAADRCANEWSSAMDRLLYHFYETNRGQSILTTLNREENRSRAFSFKVRYHELQVKWRHILDDSAASAAYASREMPKLLKNLPGEPLYGELDSLNSLVTNARSVSSDTRLRWLEALGEAAEESIRDHHQAYDHFWNLLGIRRNLAGITARRRGDPSLLDQFANDLDELASIVMADLKSESADEERQSLRKALGIFLDWLEKTKVETATPAIVGKVAAPLSGTWTEGEAETSIEELHGRVVVLDFWAIWCGPCVAEFPKLNALYTKFNRERLEVIGITRAYGYAWDSESKKAKRREDRTAAKRFVVDDAELEAIREFAGSQKVQFPLLVEDGVLSKFYGIKGVPTLVVLDQSGRIADVILGGSKESEERLFEVVASLAGEAGKE